MNETNAAARLMRAGNELSESNKKLKEAALLVVEKIAPALMGHGLLMPHTWQVSEYGNGVYGMRFIYKGSSYEIRSDDIDDQPIWLIRYFAETLAGEQGDALIDWMESTTKRGDSFTENLDRFLEL